MDTLPQNRIKYCPVCGSLHFNYDGAKSFLCADCKFHFFINAATAVVGIIENSKGEILLVKRAFDPQKGTYDLPGGFVDPMETAEEALVREIKEELNIELDEFDYLFSIPNSYVFSNYTVFTSDLAFRCKVSNFDNLSCSDDVSGSVFVDLKEVDYDKIGFDSIKKIIKLYVEKYWGTK